MDGARLRGSLPWLFPAAVLGVTVGWVQQVPALTPGADGSPEQRAAVADELRASEPAFRRDALERFPGDLWSQGDQFGAQERGLVLKLAGSHGMRPGAVLDAIDRDVKSHAYDGPQLCDRGRVAACMPRPFYE
jgi:hypothetical protein